VGASRWCEVRAGANSCRTGRKLDSSAIRSLSRMRFPIP